MEIDTSKLHPSIAHFVPLFAYDHLPPGPQAMSKPFHDLAERVMRNCEGPEASVCLRKLLESKDCAVRSCLDGGFARK